MIYPVGIYDYLMRWITLVTPCGYLGYSMWFGWEGFAFVYKLYVMHMYSVRITQVVIELFTGVPVSGILKTT
jgi:hypothetical protein